MLCGCNLLHEYEIMYVNFCVMLLAKLFASIIIHKALDARHWFSPFIQTKWSIYHHVDKHFCPNHGQKLAHKFLQGCFTTQPNQNEASITIINQKNLPKSSAKARIKIFACVFYRSFKPKWSNYHNYRPKIFVKIISKSFYTNFCMDASPFIQTKIKHLSWCWQKFLLTSPLIQTKRGIYHHVVVKPLFLFRYGKTHMQKFLYKFLLMIWAKLFG